ncbi:tripartite tricarboxylate transporter substrate binding protein [Candidimonas humi]|jgi:tripartite-type tricarboxylate transporter receptor subunit TctC|uniref:Bug family tripartite tricarboxylate transporter substrate binding protein n=1 Tax=Candidimonas humi TaxID=683355 RepID=A0ABV8P5K1_9BURK|nr:tripartite tricarboxylate transporter substrate-binding protein [Candidimonas humi]MBV6307279.1 tripartite tricarboxylate transporter substrate binding protein [Candidimonas humi]
MARSAVPFPSRRRALAAALGLAAVAAAPAWAQRGNPVMRLIVPFAPGGGNDVLGRQMAHSLGEMFKMDVIVENKPGAGGNLGTEQVVHASARSNMFLLGHTGTVSINPVLYKNLKFDASTDLQPVAMFASSSLLLVVPEKSPIRSVQQLSDTLRRKGGDMNFASSGTGTGGHLTGEMLLQVLGAKALHVPYKGTAPALTDVAGGQVDFCFSVIPAAMAMVKGGKLRALAVTSPKRMNLLPDVPTMGESGVPELKGFESTLTYGILAPKSVGADVVADLERKILDVAATPEFQSRLVVEGAEALMGGSASYGRRIQEESVKWGRVIKTAGVSV